MDTLKTLSLTELHFSERCDFLVLYVTRGNQHHTSHSNYVALCPLSVGSKSANFIVHKIGIVKCSIFSYTPN